MTLNFILGKNQFDHHQVLMDQFKQQFQKDPQGEFFFIVPNHIKFESEVQMLNDFGNFEGQTDLIASNRVQCFSLSRLAWYFLRGTDDYNKDTLTDTKSAMIIRNIIAKRKTDLDILAGMADKSGFIAQLTSQFGEFANGRVEPDDLDKALENNSDDVYTGKIKELNLIYRDYYEQIQQFASSAYKLEQLAKYFDQDIHTKHYYFYIEGFSTFTAAELNIVKSLLLNCADLSISLNLDKPALKPVERTDFYARSANTFNQLYNLAIENKIPFHSLEAKELRVSTDLAKLEDYWIQSSGVSKIEPSQMDSRNSVQVWKSTNPQAEVSAVSTYIRQLVANQNYRYKDFLVVTRDLNQYSSFVDAFMDENGIPHFIDLQRKMNDHPFKKMIDLLFSLSSRGLRSEDAIALLRTDLLLPDEFQHENIAEFNHAVDLTENYVLANGTGQRGWLGPDFEIDAAVDEETDQNLIHDYQLINLIKNYIRDVYQQLSQYFQKSHKSLDAATFLFSFLQEQGVFGQLSAWQDQAIAQNNLTAADQPQQVVDKFNEILDEYVNTFGDQTFKGDDFIEVLDAAFETAQYSQIPSTLDAVNISEIGLVQPNNRKITFVLGATVNNMPGTSVSNGIIADEERQVISENLDDGKYLNASDETMNNSEPYLHNMTFLSSSTRLIFTYPNYTSDNKQQDLSSYVSRIMDHFDIQEQNIMLNPRPDEAVESEILRYIGSADASLNYLIRVSRAALDEKSSLSSPWSYVRAKLLNDDQVETNKALESLEYKNIPVPINQDTVAHLYGNNINVSISRLETFYQNEYEYFLKYGLRLQPRKLFEITPAQTGSLYHAVLDGFVKLINNQNVDIRDLNEKQLKDFVGQIFAEQMQQPENKIFSSSERMGYMAQKAQATLLQLAKAIQEQLGHNKFVPRATEVAFGKINNTHQDLPGLSYEIAGGHKINVRGKIDRIDEMAINDTDYLAVIDYKSSTHKFDFDSFLNGISMQMPTYLENLSTNLDKFSDKKDVKIAGAFYAHIQNPKVRLQKDKDIQQELLKKFKFDGLIVADDELIDNLDTLITGRSSLILPLNNSVKNGVSVSKNHAVSDEDLFRILNYNKHLITQAGEKIYSGALQINPYRDSQNRTGLQFSDYRPILQFDAMLPENDYHEIINHGSDAKKEVLKQIQIILEGKDNNA